MSRRSSSRLADKGLKRKEAEAELDEEDRPKKKQKIEKKIKTTKKSTKNNKKQESEEESFSEHSDVPELSGSDEENSEEYESATPVAPFIPYLCQCNQEALEWDKCNYETDLFTPLLTHLRLRRKKAQKYVKTASNI